MQTPHQMKTLSECIASLQQDGYNENFMVKGKVLYAPEMDKSYEPDEINIVTFYRFEGNSDPGDSSILYAIQTKDGVKGMLTDSYGVDANPHISEFVKRVEAIEKKKSAEIK